MRKFYTAAIAAAMTASLIPLNVFADVNITPSADVENNGIRFTLSGGKADFTNGKLNVGAKSTVEIDLNDIFGIQIPSNWEGDSSFTADIIVTDVVGENGAKAGDVNFTAGSAQYNLFTDYVKAGDVQTDDFAAGIAKEVGVKVSIDGDGNAVHENDNPRYNVQYNPTFGTLTVQDVVSGKADKDVKIVVNGKNIEEENAKIVNGDTVTISFAADENGNINSGEALADPDLRVEKAAAILDKNLVNYPAQGVKKISLLNTGDTFAGVVVPEEFGRVAVFERKTDDYEIKSFADTGVIELFQAMFGDVVQADITGFEITDPAKLTVETLGTAVIDDMNNKSDMELKMDIADKLIGLLVSEARTANMSELDGKGATALVHFADGTQKTYTVFFTN